jgi:hypothetical protein
MRRIESVGLALVIVLVVGAVGAGTASASRLVLSAEGTVLPDGEPFELFGGDEHFSASSHGIFDCGTPEYEELVLYSTLESNGRKKRDTAKLEAGLEFEGELIRPPQTALVCESERGYVYVSWEPGGEYLSFGANGQASIRPVSVGAFFEIFNGGEIEELSCHYFTRALRGTNAATPTRQPLTAEFSGTLKRRDSPPRACPRTVHMSLSLPEIETNAETIEEEI